MEVSYKVSVTFRKWPDGTIDALFPYEAQFNYKVSCYSRIGQHSIADYDFVVSKTKLANPTEYHALLNELTNTVGYSVNVIKRTNRGKMLTAWAALNKRLQA